MVSGSEVALFSLDAAARESLSRRSDKASRQVLWLLSKPQHLLITILTLNTVINVTAAVLAALVTAEVAEAQQWSTAATFVVEVVVLAFVLLVVSEITPKLIASRHAESYSRFVATPLRLLYRLLFPVVTVIALLMRRTQRGFSRWFMRPDVLSPDDVKMMAEIGRAHGSLEDDEHAWIQSIVDFGDTPVRAVMINRLDIVALPVTASMSDALELIRTTGHSRLPLYVDHLDNILGIIHAKDLLPYLPSGQAASRPDWTRLMRPPMFVPMGKKLDDLLEDFQRRKTHIAIVVDEYGGTAGLVALEDVLEEVVGDFRDEHDEDEGPEYERMEDGRYRIDARINLDDLSELLNLDLDTEDFDFETLGGLVFHLAGDIPREGDAVHYGRLSLTVEAVENNRIRIVQATVAPRSEPD